MKEILDQGNDMANLYKAAVMQKEEICNVLEFRCRWNVLSTICFDVDGMIVIYDQPVQKIGKTEWMIALLDHHFFSYKKFHYTSAYDFAQKKYTGFIDHLYFACVKKYYKNHSELTEDWEQLNDENFIYLLTTGGFVWLH